MSGAWWGKEAAVPRKALLGADGIQPQLARASRTAVLSALRDRVESYAPQWTNVRPGDAGFALAKLFSEQMEPVLQRLNRLPEKALVEFLDMAGISALPPTPAKVLVEFEISDAAPGSVSIGEGFQLGAAPAGGGDLVIFETERTLLAAPAKIAEIHVQTGRTALPMDAAGDSETGRIAAFGEKPGPGSALLIGLSGDAAPAPSLALGIHIASAPGAPPPFAAGGIAPLPVPPPPTLQWDVLDFTSFEPAEIESDGTAGLTRSGLVELRLPRRWRVGRPAVLGPGLMLRWLRLRIGRGTYARPPVLRFVRLNMVSAVATRTMRDEVLEPVAGSNGRRWQLSQTPVLAGSLQLAVDEDVTSGDELQGEADRADTRWQEVSDFISSSAEQRHYVLDTLGGIVTFGDGTRGRAAPPGFRHIRALTYRVGGGAAGAVGAEAVTTLLSSAPFVTAVTNPLPASGGSDRETQRDATRRGPQEIRARGRAVTMADYELLAGRAPGARVARAYAAAGVHPAFPGLPIAGVVGVFVVPPDEGTGPPTPDPLTLRAVAEHLATVAPAGIDVVTAAPRYHRVRVEAAITLDATANAAETMRRLVDELNRFLNPLTGGQNGSGWTFGGAIGYSALLRLATHVSGIHAVERLNLVVDGARIAACTDHAISPHGLLWPELHQVIISTRGRS